MFTFGTTLTTVTILAILALVDEFRIFTKDKKAKDIKRNNRRNFKIDIK